MSNKITFHRLGESDTAFHIRDQEGRALGTLLDGTHGLVPLLQLSVSAVPLLERLAKLADREDIADTHAKDLESAAELAKVGKMLTEALFQAKPLTRAQLQETKAANLLPGQAGAAPASSNGSGRLSPLDGNGGAGEAGRR
jgi:hypothetical protein